MMLWTDRFDELHEKAVARSGLTDFGPHEYHEGLRQLLASLETSPGRSPRCDG
jgi:hypothetical protein